MTTRYLLDTNTASFVIKGNPPALRSHFSRLRSQVCISSVTEAELRYGLAKRPEAIQLKLVVEEFLLRVDILPWDSAAAQAYATARAELERAGTPLGNLDLMIGAHALATASTLITNDRAFRHLKGLKCQDWTKLAG